MAFAAALKELNLRLFAPPAAGRRSALEIIGWWERRRFAYNALVGAAGLLSIMLLGSAVVIDALILHTDNVAIPDGPLLGVFFVLFYGVMANVCYTAGWLLELVLARLAPDRGASIGPLTFKLGLGFSLLLTLIPGALGLITLVSSAVAVTLRRLAH